MSVNYRHFFSKKRPPRIRHFYYSQFYIPYRVEHITELIETNTNRSTKLGEKKETASMKIVSVDKKLQKATGAENGIMIK